MKKCIMIAAVAAAGLLLHNSDVQAQGASRKNAEHPKEEAREKEEERKAEDERRQKVYPAEARTNAKKEIKASQASGTNGDHAHAHDKDDQKKDKKEKHKDKSDHPGNGHAYGRDKDGLEGREFGQQRAAEARAKLHKDVKYQEEALARDRRAKEESDTKIREAAERLKKKRAEGTITDEVFKQQEERIALARKKVREIEEGIFKKESLLSKTRQALLELGEE